jgi:hypothetical protein
LQRYRSFGVAGRSETIPVPYRFPDRFKYCLDVLMNDSILESNNLYRNPVRNAVRGCWIIPQFFTASFPMANIRRSLISFCHTRESG